MKKRKIFRKSKYSFIDILRYHFDNFISRGIKGVVLLLFVSTLIFVLVVTTITVRIGGGEARTVLWNNLAAAINSWWPFSFDEDEISNVVLISRAVIAIFGLFFTSILIGVISERIETKVRELRRGKSNVIEKNHLIVAGYDFNNITLLKELINASYYSRKILIIDNGNKDEIENHIYTNIDVPNNVKIIVRTFETWDMENLKKCNLESSSAIVIHPMSDLKTLKTIMAIKKILRAYPNSKTHIVSGINDSDYMINFSNEKDVMFQINNLIAKIIAVSNNQVGLAKILTSIISFEGSEFYISSNNSWKGKTFLELMGGMVNAVPVGILRENSYIIAPNYDEVLLNQDELLY